MTAEKNIQTEEKQTARIESFSAGVFSIAITLLVLGIKVLTAAELGDHQSLLFALRGQWPSFCAYLVSFFTILIMWIQHHRLFAFIKCTDLPFFYLNGFLLLLVTFVPFPTTLLAEHIQHGNARTAEIGRAHV